ncbi:MAG TPA: PP2C family protein-serine/threonine phosphatase [Solirubrobacterales bacterium]|nr:PP2C family protein-serine/threonine phosphatase [Solirubrobacterales bacterium]
MSNATRATWICVAALAVFVVWLAVGGGGQVGIGFLYAVPVGMAAWWFGRRGAATAVVLCVALYVIGGVLNPVDQFAAALAVRSTVLVAVAFAVIAARERMTVLEHSAEELEAIRAALAPPSLPQLAEVDVAAAFVPSELGVSGDFYLVTNGPDGSTVAVVGDVVGHGPKAARLATFIRARFAALAASTSDPAELLVLANQSLIDRPGRNRELVSAACVRFEAEGTRLSWAIAGHPLPLHLPSLRRLEPHGSTFMLGAGPDLELTNAELLLQRDEGVVVYTDGATDVRQQGALLGIEGLTELLAPLAGLRAEAICARLQQAILEWTDQQVRDDLCLLVLKPEASGP